MDSLGAVIGPIVALVMIGEITAPNLVVLRWLFALTFIPGVLAAMSIAFLVKEKPHQPKPHARLWKSLGALPRDFKEYLLGIGIAGLGDFSNTLLILWAIQAWRDRLGLAAATSQAILFYVGYNVVYTLVCYIAGMLAGSFFETLGWLQDRIQHGGDSGHCLVAAGRFVAQICHRFWLFRRLYGIMGNGRKRHGGDAPAERTSRHRIRRFGNRQRAGRYFLEHGYRILVVDFAPGRDGLRHSHVAMWCGGRGSHRFSRRSAPQFTVGSALRAVP